MADRESAPFTPRIRKLLALSCALLAALPASAGQVRVTLSGTAFSPTDVFINQGDHVVWVWLGGSHTVTSGPIVAGVGVPDGLFDSGGAPFGITTMLGNGTQWSWKSTLTGDRDYFCTPHADFGMAGIVHISASGQPVADLRITEVQYGATGGLDRIEITNLGDVAGDLGRYRISVSNATSEQDIVPLASVAVPVGGRVTIHTNETGTPTATNLFMGGAGGIGDLATTGSVGLFVPYRTSAVTPGPLSASLMVDFVQWTAAGQPNSATATAAGVWPSGDVVSGESNPAYSISFCGMKTDRGQSFWSVTLANFGSAGPICSTPTLNTSWGRIKSIYR